MPRLLSVSRAARLVGISRGALQKRIRAGDINSFEGMVKISELSELYPNARMEDTSEIERIEHIIEQAVFKARNIRSVTPDIGTLAKRVYELSYELASAKLEVSNYNILIQKLKSKIKKHSQDASETQSDVFPSLLEFINQELSNMPSSDRQRDELFARDTLLRVVAAQVHLLPSGHEFFVQGNESILESSLSAGLAMDYGCSNGNCGKCKARLVSGQVKKIKNHDYVIPEAEKSQGYILTCSNTAITDIVLNANEAGTEEDIPLQSIDTKVRKLEHPNSDISLLSVKTPRTQRLRFLAGQSALLKTADGEETLLPIASCPCDDMNIQFHIHRNNSSLFEKVSKGIIKTGDNLSLTGPKGDFVLNSDSENPIIFIAFNTGFAPIKSLIEHAMTLDRAEKVHLFWIAGKKGHHYLHNLCRSWTDALETFTYTPLMFDTSDSNELGTALDQISEAYEDFSEFDAYIAGTLPEVEQSKVTLIAIGANEQNINTCII